VISLWIILVTLAVAVGNAAQTGDAEDPIYFTLGIVVLESFRRENSDQMRIAGSQARLIHGLALMVLVPVFCGTILMRDVAAFSYSVAWNALTRPSIEPSRRFHSAALRDFFVPANTGHITDYWAARDHPARINEGIDLLRKHLRRGDRVTAIAYTNPFSFALGCQPARDALQWWGLNMTFDRKIFPSPDAFLGNASLVMVPKVLNRGEDVGSTTLDCMLDLYGAYLRSNFERMDSSEVWTLYRRRGAAAGHPSTSSGLPQ
jgi:hypothetical protein